jgi:hypothetical protein
MHRRAFLRTTGVATLGAWLAACGGGTTKKTPGKTLQALAAGRQQNVNLISASEELLVREGGDRFPFALFIPNSTNDRYQGGTARVWIASDANTAEAMGPFEATWHDEGIPERGVYVTRLPFPKDGAWLALVEARPVDAIVQGQNHPTSLTVLGGTTLGVGRRGKSPIPGEKAISVATPTFSNAHGVKPICTSKPACSMHDTSLDVALRNGKPTVVIISTPRFCQSRTCGPVNDILDGVRKADGNRAAVNFVHIEVYKDDTDAPAKGIFAPAAAAWKTETEPAIYFVKPDGTIAERFIGATDRREVADQVTALRQA